MSSPFPNMHNDISLHTANSPLAPLLPSPTQIDISTHASQVPNCTRPLPSLGITWWWCGIAERTFVEAVLSAAATCLPPRHNEGPCPLCLQTQLGLPSRGQHTNMNVCDGPYAIRWLFPAPPATLTSITLLHGLWFVSLYSSNAAGVCTQAYVMHVLCNILGQCGPRLTVGRKAITCGRCVELVLPWCTHT
jgi:hypothetical protein